MLRAIIISVSTTSSQKLPPETPENAQKELVEKVKAQWKLLWNERYNDKVRAEGISVNDYEILRVERGTIIHATRDFKALNFREILQQNMVEDPERFVQPDLNLGGWNKFIKKEIINGKLRRKRSAAYAAENLSDKHGTQQAKKGGRGWLHSK